MIQRIVLKDGRYVILTTRRAAYVPYIFGKASIYKSKESYDKNNVLRDGYTVMTSVRLGNTLAGLPAAIDEFIKGLETEVQCPTCGEVYDAGNKSCPCPVLGRPAKKSKQTNKES